MKDFDHLIGDARKQAKKAGLKKGDIKKTIKKVRRHRENYFRYECFYFRHILVWPSLSDPKSLAVTSN